MEKIKQKEIQAQQMEEQRQQFKLKTQNLLKFSEETPEPKSARVGRKKKERSGDIYSEGEEIEGTQPSTKKKRCGIYFLGITEVSPSMIVLNCTDLSSFSGSWNRGVPLYTEMSSFQGVGIEEFHCIQRCPRFRVLE